MLLTNRRTFLKTTAAGTVALSSLSELTANPDKKYKTALIGCGWWGNNILKYAMECGECKI
ncbi:MAG: twin-arginine translocation signal domain-containing protein, partial [Candidatus Omnitrophica bacterium]|nr:twin-arginine translocation signal domain-containing protein [Candidatus Omnitrophota bacterium]